MKPTATLFDQNDDAAKQAPPPKVPTKAKPKAAKASQKKAGTAVAVHQPKAPAKPKRGTSEEQFVQVMSMIDGAARDPNVDPAKYRALLDMRKELKEEQSREAFIADYLKMQAELATIRIEKKGAIKIFAKNDPEHMRPAIQTTPYAKYDDLNRVIRPILQRHGFVLIHRNANGAEGKPITKTFLRHKGGAQEESEFMGEIDASGSKNNVQGRGSTLSYGKRYNAVALLDLITDDDDGGNKGKDDKISNDQLTELIEVCEVSGVDKIRFCKALKIDALADLPARRFDDACTMAKMKAGQTRAGS